MSGTARLAVVIAVAVSVMLGCSPKIAGTAVKAPGRTGGDAVDVSRLDTGNYPTTPRTGLGVAGSTAKGATLEAHRMASNVVGPWQADSSLIEFEQFNTLPVKGPEALNDLLGKPIGDGVAQHHFVVGFTSARHNAGGSYKGLANFVLRFASPQDATAAAQDMAAKTVTITPALGATPVATQSFSVPRYPGSAAVTYQWAAPVVQRGDAPFAVMAFTVHGVYVLCQRADDAESAERAGQLVATTLDLQQPLIDQFSPTPADALARLPIDPNGLLAHTLPASAGNETVNDGVYDPAGALHLEANDPVHLQALFKSVGLQQAVETAEIRVYQTPDPGAAERVVADYAGSPDPQAAGITGMPKAKCFKETLAAWCVASADRYAFLVQAAQQGDLHQRMAAQYRVLTGK